MLWKNTTFLFIAPKKFFFYFKNCCQKFIFLILFFLNRRLFFVSVDSLGRIDGYGGDNLEREGNLRATRDRNNDYVGYYQEMNGNCPGGSMGSPMSLSLSECAKECYDRGSDCQGFSYRDPNGCVLKRMACVEPEQSPTGFVFYRSKLHLNFNFTS